MLFRNGPSGWHGRTEGAQAETNKHCNGVCLSDKSELLRAFVKRITRASSSARPTTRTPTPRWQRANGVIGDTLRANANGCKGDWDSHVTLAEFAIMINNTASTLGDDLTPFFIRVDRCAQPRLPLSPSHHDLTAGESPAHYAQRMRATEATVLELLVAAQANRKANLDPGRVDTVFQVGGRVLLRTEEPLDASRHW